MNSICLMVTLSWAGLVSAQKDAFVACTVTACSERSLIDCALNGEPWASVVYEGQRVCVCCEDEKDARLIAGANVIKGQGLFWGNRYKVCETIYTDEADCLLKKKKDCNYQTISFKGGVYVGCYFCRRRCSSSLDCQDTGGVCSINRRNSQPVRSCTNAIPPPVYPGTNVGHDYIPGLAPDIFAGLDPDETLSLQKRQNATRRRRRKY